MPDSPESSGVRLTRTSGLALELNANGSMRRFECNGIFLNLFVGNEMEGGPANLYLRRLSGNFDSVPLLGPRSNTRFVADAASGSIAGFGSWLGINYSIALVLAESSPAWFWHVSLENTNSTAQRVDLTYTQDVALASYGAIRLNEFYVSQYLDHTPLTHPEHGIVIASRQNQAIDGRIPWSLIGSLRKGASFATDALQFNGLATRAGDTAAGLVGELPGKRLQHEHSLVVIRDEPITLEVNKQVTGGFFGSYLANHADATSVADLGGVAAALSLPEAQPRLAPHAAGIAQSPAASNAATLFSAAPFLRTVDLEPGMFQSLFGTGLRHEELDENGAHLSFFHGLDRHVVLRAKELRVTRPHGHVLRTGRHLTPDESALTSTAWMSGVFHSMLTQGHVSINRFLSTVHTYLGLFRSHGQRIFVDVNGAWQLLGVSSAFEMSPNACRWIYCHAEGVIEVRSEARSDPHELRLSIEVTSGKATRFLISHHIAMNGDDGSVPGAARYRRDGKAIVVEAAPGGDVGNRFPDGNFTISPMDATEFATVGGDELLFVDGRSRQQPFVCIATAAVRSARLAIKGNLVPEASPKPLSVDGAQELIPVLSLPEASDGANARSGEVAQLADIVPWYTHNAFVHYLSPRGLEQYSGGGWGTRDVCQGPVEMLFALGRIEPVRDLLLRVMSQQNADGDWPQWFMFFERERNIRPGDSHGDIVFWPLVVLAQYLIASGDAAVLDAPVRFFDSGGPDGGELATVWRHVERALGLISKRVIPGTALAAYGHGDWNDSLQPADPALRERMCSAWTVTLHFQMLTSLARALRSIGRDADAAPLEAAAAAVLRDFQRLLLVDGVLTGYAHFEENDAVRYLLHPRDQTTGVRYSSLAMIHAILEDLLTPGQARDHLQLIETHLSAPDGVRLFDRPMTYHGGPQRLFQRAETATFFGREIGLMYVHAHLRYAQALAHLGEAERFFRALCQASPIGIRSIVPAATLRQANCYYSSSDAAFADRYQASEEYDRVANGTIALDGGWRVYSSGAGIALGLIIRHFLGLTVESKVLSVDPVIPSNLDGLRVGTTLLGQTVEVRYRIGKAGCGVTAVTLNDEALSFSHAVNPHRLGAALVPIDAVQKTLTANRNVLAISIG